MNPNVPDYLWCDMAGDREREDLYLALVDRALEAFDARLSFAAKTLLQLARNVRRAYERSLVHASS